jgi:hypothetical protein
VGGPENKQITPDSVRQAIRASYEGGASGVCLSRNYSEARLENVAAVGQALDELGIDEWIPDSVGQVKNLEEVERSVAEESDRVF